MSRRRWVVAAAAVACLVLALALAAAWRGRTPAAGSAGQASGSPGRATAGPSEAALASGSAAVIASATADATTRPTLDPTPTARPTPAATPRPPTAPPRTTADPRHAWAEFLLRLNDDRATVEGLNRALLAATDDTDLVAVRAAAVDILDFVDREVVWLRQHPPADCYAEAHASASAMLAAYADAAERFIDWTAAGGGLAGLGAFGLAVERAGAAADALDAFVRVLEATTCPA
jgi:hypothetical protein